jgi:small-conductance mechanosensitive channel
LRQDSVQPPPRKIRDVGKDPIGENLTELFEWLRHNLDWAPDSIAAVVILAFAAALGLGLHRLFFISAQRLLGKHPYIYVFIGQARGLTRVAVVVLALGLALPAAPLSPAIAALIGRTLLLATIVLIGWAALTALAIASDLYLLRFRIDVEDNLLARKHVTQVRLFKRALEILLTIVTIAAALMTFESVRQYGVSLFASAGIAGIAVGLAARPVLSNLIAGVQIAMTQPIRIDDAVLVENEWGWIEDITATYVVIKLWDWRRLVVPLSYFIEKPFQNWTREGSAIIGSVFIHADYSVPVARVRTKLEEIVRDSKLWDRAVVNLQVTEAKERSVELRALVSSRTSPANWDLRCEVREKLIAFLQEEFPHALPHERAQVEMTRLVPDDAPRERRKAGVPA